MKRLAENNIQTRPIWRLNHLQKPYKNHQAFKIKKANNLVEKGLCLPSSSKLTKNEVRIIINKLVNK